MLHRNCLVLKDMRKLPFPILWKWQEGQKDGSIKTEYAKEISELLPLINFWLMPSVFPATEEELHHKYHFVIKVLDHMGLPLFDDEIVSFTEKFINDISQKGGNEP